MRKKRRKSRVNVRRSSSSFGADEKRKTGKYENAKPQRFQISNNMILV